MAERASELGLAKNADELAASFNPSGKIGKGADLGEFVELLSDTFFSFFDHHQQKTKTKQNKNKAQACNITNVSFLFPTIHTHTHTHTHRRLLG